MILNIVKCQHCGKNYVNHEVLAIYCCPECAYQKARNE